MKQDYDVHGIHDFQSRSFSVDEFLALQELFITYGFHTIKVDSFDKGRALLDVFLKTHANYHECAVLSDVPLHTSYTVLEIYRDERFFQAVDHQDALTDYILNTLYVDFLAIECTTQVLTQRWYRRFEQLVQDLNLANTLTIVKIVYS